MLEQKTHRLYYRDSFIAAIPQTSKLSTIDDVWKIVSGCVNSSSVELFVLLKTGNQNKRVESCDLPKEDDSYNQNYEGRCLQLRNSFANILINDSSYTSC